MVTNGLLGDVSALQSEISRLRAELDLTKEKLASVNKQTPILVGRGAEYNGKVFSDVVVRTMRYNTFYFLLYSDVIGRN